MNLVTKVHFPREILPLGVLAAAFVDFCIASVIFVGMMIAYGIPAYATLAWLPLLVFVQILLTVGVTLVGAAVNVFFRDIRFVVPLGLQLWLYATPVIYPISLVPERLRVLYMLNPMAGLIASYRRVALQGLPPAPREFGSAALLAAVLCIGGYLLFKRLERQFADII
jgi:lipopolysaccharide transport system permease protein